MKDSLLTDVHHEQRGLHFVSTAKIDGEPYDHCEPIDAWADKAAYEACAMQCFERARRLHGLDDVQLTGHQIADICTKNIFP